jgi:hypothetical protein
MKRGSMRRKVSECRHFKHNRPKKQEKRKGLTGFTFLKKKQVTNLLGEKKIRYLVSFEFI